MQRPIWSPPRSSYLTFSSSISPLLHTHSIHPPLSCPLVQNNSRPSHPKHKSPLKCSLVKHSSSSPIHTRPTWSNIHTTTSHFERQYLSILKRTQVAGSTPLATQFKYTTTNRLINIKHSNIRKQHSPTASNISTMPSSRFPSRSSSLNAVAPKRIHRSLTLTHNAKKKVVLAEGTKERSTIKPAGKLSSKTKRKSKVFEDVEKICN